MLTLPILELRGTDSDMGRQYGEAVRSQIQTFVSMRLEAVRKYFEDRKQPGWQRLLDVGRESFAIYRDWDPSGYAEQVGIAEGANLSAEELFTVCNMTDLRDAVILAAAHGGKREQHAAEGCSSVLVSGARTSSGGVLAGQTWDLNPPDVDYVVAIHRRPKDGPQTWAMTCTGCLTLMGMSEHGLSLGTTNIKTYGSKPGVGYLSILHRALRERTTEAAAASVRTAPHAGAHTYWMVDANGGIELECSPNAIFERDLGSEVLYRTNHCLAPLHQELEGEEPSESSRTRFERIGELLVPKQDFESLKGIFADRSRGPLSVNRYAEDNLGTATNAVFIASPSERKAWGCRGPADRGEWVEFRFE